MSNKPFILTNQFGEESINTVQQGEGFYVPLPGPGKLILMNGATAPVDGTTGDNIAGTGSLYIARDTGVVYQQTSLITSPVWTACGSATTGALLTGYSASAGALVAGDTVLGAFDKLGPIMNGTFAPTSETVSSAGALSTTKMLSNVANSTGSGIAVTLAAPSSQDGQLKLIKMTTRTSHDITLAMTNIAMSGAYTPTGTTTLTFGAVGDTAVLVALGSKWVYLGGSAVAS